MSELLRSLLFVPGSSAKMIEKSRSLPADAIIFDLEDAVSPSEKDAAREQVAAAVRDRQGNAGGQRLWVRINAVGDATQVADVQAMVNAGPDAIMLPKADAASLAVVEAQLDELEAAGSRPIPIVALVESCRGLLDAERMCLASRRLIGLQLGAEDLTKEMGIARTTEGVEILMARSQLAIVGHAFGKHVLDTPNTAVNDLEQLRGDIDRGRQLGMTGKTCIHPKQLPVVNQEFTPDAEEVAQAERIVTAFDQAVAEGRGAFALDGKMIDAPIAERARALLHRAAAAAARDNR